MEGDKDRIVEGALVVFARSDECISLFLSSSIIYLIPSHLTYRVGTRVRD